MYLHSALPGVPVPPPRAHVRSRGDVSESARTHIDLGTRVGADDSFQIVVSSENWARRRTADPNDPEARFGLGMALLAEARDFVEALGHLRAADRLGASALAQPRSRHAAQATIVRHLEALGGNGRAFDALRKAARAGSLSSEDRLRFLLRAVVCGGILPFGFPLPGEEAGAPHAAILVRACDGDVEGALGELDTGDAEDFGDPGRPRLRGILASLLDLEERGRRGDVDAWSPPDLPGLRKEVGRARAAIRERQAAERRAREEELRLIGPEWHDLGFADFEAREWKAGGFDPESAFVWRLTGHGARRAAAFRGAGWHEDLAARWVGTGVDPVRLGPDRAGAWEATGLVPAAAASWIAAGFDRSAATGWIEVGVAAPQRASEWRDAGFVADQARPWIDAGVSPQEASRLRERGERPRGDRGPAPLPADDRALLVWGLAFHEPDRTPWGAPLEELDSWRPRWDRRSAGAETPFRLLRWGRLDHFVHSAVVAAPSIREASVGSPTVLSSVEVDATWEDGLDRFCTIMEIPRADAGWILMAVRG